MKGITRVCTGVRCRGLMLVLGLAVVSWAAIPAAVAAPPPAEFFEDQPAARHLSAERLEGAIGQELLVDIALPEGVNPAEFTIEARVISPGGESGLELAVEGLGMRVKASKAGEFVVAVVGIRPSPHAM
jgi:hypothetical protein